MPSFIMIAILLFGGETVKQFIAILFIGSALRNLFVDLHSRAAVGRLGERRTALPGQEAQERRNRRG